MMNRKTFLKYLAASSTAMVLGHKASQASASVTVIPPTGLSGMDTGSWAAVRELFPLSPKRIYFNTGGLGPTSNPVLEAMHQQALRQAIDGEHHHSLLHRVRETTAGIFGAHPDEIAFVRNATEGNSVIANGLDLKAGDEVIFESHAHPGGSFPWLARQKEIGIKVRIFEPDPDSPEENLQRILSLVNDRTKVIQVSHVTAPTGILFDVMSIARACRERGIWFHIDGAQSAGMIPFNLNAIACDSYATSGHKWLNGPQESGFLYIAKSRLDEVACSHAGAYSSGQYKLPDTFVYAPFAHRHEYGTRDAASILGLETALRLQQKIGLERIAKHGKKLVAEARLVLGNIDGVKILTPGHPDMHNSILSFRIAGKESGDLYRRLLEEHNLRCRNVTERGINAIRISWHVYNSEADLESLEKAVRSLVS
ncbi:MAG: aminotransferase class V-fold PLP-dependent enzyme [Puniceicoccaceae bacterium]